MSFIKRDIKDRVVEHPRRYDLVKVAGHDNRYDLAPAQGTVVEEGTPVNKELLQRYEDGLEDFGDLIDDLEDLINENKVVAGVYTGDDATSKIIDLGFRPKAVLILRSGVFYGSSSSSVRGGLAIDGLPVLAGDGNAILVSATGFTVYKGSSSSTNNDTWRYHYAAFR